MTENQSSLKPGDQVCIIDDVYDMDEYHNPLLTVEKGTFGTVISFEEYLAAYPYYRGPDHRAPFELEWEKSVLAGRMCPVYWGVSGVKISLQNAARISRHQLATLDFLDQKTIFVLGMLRVICADGNDPLQPDWGYKTLCVNFILENRGKVTPGSVSSLRIWLTNSDLGYTSQDTPQIEPVRIDLSDRELENKLFGQAVFKIPADRAIYSFHLELPNVGTIVKAIRLSDLQPGDRIRVKRNTLTAGIRPRVGRHNPQAAEGSTGIIVTFSQYREYLKSVVSESWFEECSAVDKKQLEDCNLYGCKHPVQFEKVNHSSDANSVYEGEIVRVRASELEKIE